MELIREWLVRWFVNEDTADVVCLDVKMWRFIDDEGRVIYAVSSQRSTPSKRQGGFEPTIIHAESRSVYTIMREARCLLTT